MKKRVNNIKGLAAYLGLSIATVSRVLNGKSLQYRISSQTSKRVLAAARAFNYSPNKIARGLKLTKTETIGLIVPDIANPFFASIAKSIEAESRKFGYSMTNTSLHYYRQHLGSFQATEYLIGMGHRKIACIKVGVSL